MEFGDAAGRKFYATVCLAMSSVYSCPNCGARFDRETAQRMGFECPMRKCRGRKDGRPGDEHRIYDNRLWFLTASKYGTVWHAPDSLNPAARGVERKSKAIF